MADVPSERTFATLEALDELAESDPNSIMDLLGQRIDVGGRPALVQETTLDVTSKGRLHADYLLRWLDEPI